MIFDDNNMAYLSSCIYAISANGFAVSIKAVADQKFCSEEVRPINTTIPIQAVVHFVEVRCLLAIYISDFERSWRRRGTIRHAPTSAKDIVDSVHME